jgi:hypothetical protein
MRNTNRRLWAGLVLSSLLLVSSGVGAQGSQRIPQTPPPYVQECLETANAMNNFVIMRKAKITKEEAITAFHISIKLGQYVSIQQGRGPIPPEKIKAQRAVIDAVYDLPEKVMTLDEALLFWMRSTTQKCIKDNSPRSPMRMVPS